MKNLFLSTCALVVGMSFTAEAKKNIIFVAFDDLKPILGCYGDKMVKSPNIDKLAQQGITFTNAHCQQAVCGPSRASIMSGLYPDTTQVWDLKTKWRDINPDILSIPQFFKNQGYETAGTGKIYDYRSVDSMKEMDAPSWTIPFDQNPFHGPLGKTQGYAKPETALEQKRFKEKLAETNTPPAKAALIANEWKINSKPFYECETNTTDDSYADATIVKHGLELMETLAKKDKPFFLGIGFKKPHLPFNAPKKYWDLYDESDIELHPFQQKARDGGGMGYHNFGELRMYTPIPVSGPLDEATQRKMIHGYYACVSYVDALFGQILDKLEALQIADNTIVVVWGDHGWHLGDHGLWCKHTNLEQATRSPLIIFDPSMSAKGLKASAPVEFVDVFPTLVDLADFEIPSHLQGKSLKPIYEDPEFSVREAALSQFPAGQKIMGYSIRTKRYRYSEWEEKHFMSDKKARGFFNPLLFDYEKDPMETVNLANDPAYAEVLKEMKQLMAEKREAAYIISK